MNQETYDTIKNLSTNLSAGNCEPVIKYLIERIEKLESQVKQLSNHVYYGDGDE